ncbi:replication initiation protein [Hymenobacter sp. AT01-02]|uniref:replication initiation protein n=1 Tax=Hymenobacter sp. AT01-02 TaxID=1571877 RepID=UPI0006E3AF60|nr:replication initiation protein [Hymenobacter sp. AT01-02]
MLREYGDFGKRTLTLKQLRFALDIDEHEYREFKNLKVRILDKAQDEIAATDIPFTYDVEREGRSVKRIVFAFPPAGTATKMTSVARPVWQQRLIERGVGNRSISTIEAQLSAGDYDEGYVDYVLRIVENQFRKGKIKKPAGAIYKALVEKYLLEDYRQATVASKPLRAAALKALPPKAEEVAFRLSEVREMYENPGPYAQRQKRADTFEQHLQQVYLQDGFTVEERAGEDWLVKGR